MHHYYYNQHTTDVITLTNRISLVLLYTTHTVGLNQPTPESQNSCRHLQ
jgi:hypothetical protein